MRTCVPIAECSWWRYVYPQKEQDHSWFTLSLKFTLLRFMYELTVTIDKGIETSSGLKGSKGLQALFAAALSH